MITRTYRPHAQLIRAYYKESFLFRDHFLGPRKLLIEETKKSASHDTVSCLRNVFFFIVLTL